jgi:hypothetical protein
MLQRRIRPAHLDAPSWIVGEGRQAGRLSPALYLREVTAGAGGDDQAGPGLSGARTAGIHDQDFGRLDTVSLVQHLRGATCSTAVPRDLVDVDARRSERGKTALDRASRHAYHDDGLDGHGSTSDRCSGTVCRRLL